MAGVVSTWLQAEYEAELSVHSSGRTAWSKVCSTGRDRRPGHLQGTYREALTEAGRRLGSSMPLRSPPPWPPLPTALDGRPMEVSLDTKSSCCGLGTRGKMVSK